MLLTRTPLRISLVGGGTDMPSFFRKHTGAVVSFAINKYVYVSVNKKFDGKLRVSYSKTENVDSVDDLQHELVRESMRLFNLKSGLEITSVSDIPGNGTGLGSSSSFTVGLLKALGESTIGAGTLAERAYTVEADKCLKAVGKQDHYAAAFGGLNHFTFGKDKVNWEPISPTLKLINELESHSLLLWTGIARDANEILKKQNRIFSDGGNIEIGRQLSGLASDLNVEMRDGITMPRLGEFLQEGWRLKKFLAQGISNKKVDDWYETGMWKGAYGGKLCFVPSTLVRTPNGYEEISNILSGDFVLDHKAEIQIVSNVIKREYSGEVLRIKVKGLLNDIVCTPEHPFFTTKKASKGYKRNGMKIPNIGEFTEAKNLIPSDYLLIPVDEFVSSKNYIVSDEYVKISASKYSSVDVYDGFPKEILLDHNFMYLLGWYIAEGSNSKKQIHFTMCSDEEVYAEKIRECFLSIFNKKSTIQHYEKGTSINVVVSSVVISALFSELCGKLAENKKIPDICLYQPLETQATLLRSLWLGDGAVLRKYDKRTDSTHFVCAYKTVSFNLAKQVQHLCHRLGYITSVRKYAVQEHQDVFVVSVHGEDAVAFKGFIESGNATPVKRKNSKGLSLSKEFVNIDGSIYIKRAVMAIESEQYDGVVYNLSVDNSNTYIAEDVAVHNCGAGAGGFMYFLAPPYLHDLIIKETGLSKVDFKLEHEGAKIVYEG